MIIKKTNDRIVLFQSLAYLWKLGSSKKQSSLT